jgi:hypothetical protein
MTVNPSNDEIRRAKRPRRTPRSRPVCRPSVRLTVTFSDPAIQWLEQEAVNRAISVADLLRRIVDETRGSYIVEQKRDGDKTS